MKIRDSSLPAAAICLPCVYVVYIDYVYACAGRASRRACGKLQVDVTNYGEVSCRLRCRAVLRLSRSRRVSEQSESRWCWHASLLLSLS